MQKLFVKADAFDVDCGSLWKFKVQNFHKPPSAYLEILKSRISTNALILKNRINSFHKTTTARSHPLKRGKNKDKDALWKCGNHKIHDFHIPTGPALVVNISKTCNSCLNKRSVRPGKTRSPASARESNFLRHVFVERDPGAVFLPKWGALNSV